MFVLLKKEKIEVNVQNYYLKIFYFFKKLSNGET